MPVKSNFIIPPELLPTTALRQLLLQIINKLDVAISKQNTTKLPDNATLSDVIKAINETK